MDDKTTCENDEVQLYEAKFFPCPKIQAMTVKSVMHDQWPIQMHLTFQATKDEKFHHNMHPRVFLGNKKI